MKLMCSSPKNSKVSSIGLESMVVKEIAKTKSSTNLDILNNLESLKELGYPVLVSFSNKKHTRSLFPNMT